MTGDCNFSRFYTLGQALKSQRERAPYFSQTRSVQDGSASDVSGLIEVLSLMDSWLTFLEPALGNDLERQHFLNDLLPFFSVWLLLGRNPDEIFTALGCQCIPRRSRWRVGKTTSRCNADTLLQVKITVGVRHGKRIRKPEVGRHPGWVGMNLSLLLTGFGKFGGVCDNYGRLQPGTFAARPGSTDDKVGIGDVAPNCAVTAIISAIVISSPDRCTSNVLASCSGPPPRADGWANSFRTASPARSSPLASTWITEPRLCRPRSAAWRSPKETFNMPESSSIRLTPSTASHRWRLAMSNASWRLTLAPSMRTISWFGK